MNEVIRTLFGAVVLGLLIAAPFSLVVGGLVFASWVWGKLRGER